jgi:hypothetical protein
VKKLAMHSDLVLKICNVANSFENILTKINLSLKKINFFRDI